SLAGHLADPPGMTRNFRIMFSHGPIARDVADLELALRVIAGPDGRDSEVPPIPLPEPGEVHLDTLRVAFAPAFPGSPVADDISAAVEGFAASLSGQVAKLGQALPDIDFPAERQLFSDLADGLSFAIYPTKEGRTPMTLRDYLVLLD